MSVITYDLVYRDGAVSGAPVSNFYLCDTGIELNAITGMKNGDMAYAKEYRNLYVFNNGWYICFDGGTIHQDLRINKNVPELKLIPTGSTIGYAIQGIANDRMFISNNTNPAAGWIKDDPNKSSLTIGMGTQDLYLWRQLVGEGPIDVLRITDEGTIVARGAIYEYYRSQPQGTWTYVPYNSNDFQPASIVTLGANTYYFYTLIGKTCHVSFVSSGGTLSSDTYININTPPGIVAHNMGAGQYIGSGVCWDGSGPANMVVAISSGGTSINLGRDYFGQFKATGPGNFYMQFCISFGIQ